MVKWKKGNFSKQRQHHYKSAWDLGWCGSVDWVLDCKTNGRWFDSQSGHMPGLQTRSPAGGRARGNQTLLLLSLSFSLPSPISKNNIFFFFKCSREQHVEVDTSWLECTKTSAWNKVRPWAGSHRPWKHRCPYFISSRKSLMGLSRCDKIRSGFWKRN